MLQNENIFKLHEKSQGKIVNKVEISHFPTKADDYTRMLRKKKMQDALQEKRLLLVHNLDEKHLQDVDAKVKVNVKKMQDPASITVDTYYQKLYEGISEEDLETAVKIRANRLASLWEKIIKELRKLEGSLDRELSTFDSTQALTFSPGKFERYQDFIQYATLIDDHIFGIRISLENLKGVDSDRKSLAVGSSASRQEFLEEYLTNLVTKDLGVDLVPLQELSEKVKEVVAGIGNYHDG